MEKYNSCYATYLANAKSKPTGILNVSFFSGYLSMGVIKIGCWVTQNITECPFKARVKVKGESVGLFGIH